MPDTFRGLYVPRMLTKDTPINTRVVGCAMKSITGMMSGNPGEDYGCRACWSCSNCICGDKNRDDLAKLFEYWKGADRSEIKPGMLVEVKRCLFPNDWVLVQKVEGDRIEGYKVDLAQFRPAVRLVAWSEDDCANLKSAVKTVYAPRDAYLSVTDIYQILDGHPSERVVKLYPKPEEEPPLEITVDELEKQYGRKVKIVGGKHA